MQSVYFWRIDLFAQDITKRWTSDQKTGQAYPSADFHFELWAECKEAQDVLAIVSRDHAKTTAVSKILVLWLLLYEMEPSILLVMARGLGEKVIGDIRRELETNDTIKCLYGLIVPMEDKQAAKLQKWRQRELQLLNGTEIKAITKGEAIRGARPTKVFVDDPQEERDVKNPRIAEAFYSWFFTTVYPVLSSNGSMVVLGTIISDMCFVNLLKQEAPNKNVKVIEYPAILDFDPKKDIDFIQEGDRLRVKFKRGRPLWPERWSMQSLQERCEKMMETRGGIDIRKFLQEYLNIPFVLNGSPVFPEDLKFDVITAINKIGYVSTFREFKRSLDQGFDQDTYYSVGIDIANGRVGGDFSTIVIRDMNFKLYKQYRGWCTQDALAGILDKMLEGLENVIIVPENNIGLAFLYACREFPEWYDKIYRTVTMDKVTQKETEILGWHTNVKTKIVMINMLQRYYATGNNEVSAEILSEILHYYFDENGSMNAIAPYHDDLVIADALCTQGILKGVPDVMPEFV